MQEDGYIEYEYGQDGRIEVIYSNSVAYTFTYDAYGNKTAIRAGGKLLASYEYAENNGKLQKTTYGNGFSEDYVYNTLEMLSEVWYTVGTTRTKAYAYEYTAYGQVHQYTDYISGKTTLYQYDNDRRIIGFIEYSTDGGYHNYSQEISYNDQGQLYTTRYKYDYAYNTLNTTSASISYSRFYLSDGRISKVSFDSTAADGDETFIYDNYNRLSGKSYYYYNSPSNPTQSFRNNVAYTYKESASNTTTLPVTYTTTVNNGTPRTYTYTYDGNGNITRIYDSYGNEQRYVYDNLGQLVREDNDYTDNTLDKTIVYTYDKSGNRTSKKTYALTAAGTAPSVLKDSQTYTYGALNTFGDVLVRRNSDQFYLDNLGNPETYSNSKCQYQFTWNGRRLLNGTCGQDVYFSFTYNDSGIRTSKTVNGVKTTYYLDGSRIIAEETNSNLIIYVYDAQGAPIGFQYHGASYSMGSFDVYW